MFIRINTSSGVPIYRQIVDQIKVAVASELLTKGEKLPSVRALSEELVINPTTVQRAYVELEREGVIETRRGQGTFVLGEGIQLADGEKARRLRELLANAMAEAQRLKVDEDEVRELFEGELRRFYSTGKDEGVAG